MHSEWVGRLEHWIHTLKQDIFLPLCEIAFEGFFTMDHLTPEQALAGYFQDVAAGTKWGKTYEYCWLKATITVPEGSAPRYALNLPVGSEATLFLDGQAFGTYRADWVVDPLHYIVDNFLPADEPAGTTHELLVEAYAGHYFPQSKLGGCATGPVMPGAYEDPNKDGERTEIGPCSLGMWNEDAYQLLMDVWALRLLMEQQDENALRANKIARALEQFTLKADFEQPLKERIQSYRRAREVLAPALAAHNGSTAPVFYAIGNAHLDLAWLWPMAETHRKTARTFAAQLRLLEEYPNYMFLQSQPASYMMCREHYPELYERVREAIRGGRWIAEGAMWAEPDTNMTSGESLIRQVLQGKRFFKDELGVDSQMLWLPDSFGYSAALPQILKGCGVKYLVTQKIFWSYNEGDQFPYHYFTWQGADGTAIDTFLPTSYTYRTDPKEICEAWNKRVQKSGLDAFLLPFGYGDGGGGPCRDYIEMLKREEDLEGMPRVQVAPPITFFSDMEAAGGPDHTYVGELYFSAHRGVYTVQAAIKKGNRLGELRLRDAEMWGALAQRQGYVYPYADMDAQWKLLLLNQFHDILPGSSIERVYVEARRDHENIIKAAARHAQDAQAALVKQDDGVTLFNSLSFERQAVVTLPAGFESGAAVEGSVIPTQKTDDGVLALVTLPPCGAVTLAHANASLDAAPCTATKQGMNVLLINEHVTVTINPMGEVISFVHKQSGREFAAGAMNRLLMYKDVPRLFDAWDIDSNYELQPVALDEPATVTVVISKGLQASVKVTRAIGASHVSQIIRLSTHSDRLDFITTVEWNELHRLLKVAFPVDVRATEAINEIQFGYMRRPTHRSRPYDSDRFEVCNQRYTALCDQSHGAAVLNDCKYGISLHGNEMRLTLLRATASPEMRADNGIHTFTYSFLGWEGGFLDAPVVREAYDLNVAPTITRGSLLHRLSAFSVDAPNVFIDTVKPAEDQSGDMILRLYEAKGADTNCALTINLPVEKISVCDMLENPTGDLDASDSVNLHFHTFEVKTLRVRQK